MPFCSACGASIADAAAFCTACGQAVAPESPAAPQAPPAIAPTRKKLPRVLLGCGIAFGLLVVLPLGFFLLVGIYVGTATAPEERANRVETAADPEPVPDLPKAADTPPAEVPKAADTPPAEVPKAAEAPKAEAPKAAEAPQAAEPPAAAAKVPPANPAERRSLRKALRTLMLRGRSMENLRQSKSPRTLRHCGERMREAQAQARKLQARAAALEKTGFLITGANILELCVSCMLTAQESCDQVEDMLKLDAKMR